MADGRIPKMASGKRGSVHRRPTPPPTSASKIFAGGILGRLTDIDVNRLEQLASCRRRWRKELTGSALKRVEAKLMKAADKTRARRKNSQANYNPARLILQVQPLLQRLSLSSGPVRSQQALLHQLASLTHRHVHGFWKSTEANDKASTPY